MQGATVWTRVVGLRSKKENSIHIKNGRGHTTNGEDISRMGEGASLNWMEEEGEEQDKKEMSASW